MRNISHLKGGVIIALLNILIFITLGKPWSITSGESHFVANIENFVSNTHVSSNLYFQKYIPETNWRVILDFGIIAGAFLGAIAGRDFKIRIPQNRWRFLQVFIGGLLMGFGARLAYGCNIGHIMSGVPQLAISSFIALISIAGGAYIGAKIIVRLI
ncbi:MAG TPA: YeeE/YedE family protein [Euryarchaeota archaeon]|nr:putative inner membrane protein [archaeon BMS3Bbin15]HDL14995.1 YeeE/YedE family protein [Euryarchaeota archaeon]